jgi:hypothetical protein
MIIIQVEGKAPGIARDVARRSRLRYSLRSLILVVTALCVWLGWNAYQVRKREALRMEIGWRGAVVRSGGGQETLARVPVVWRCMGAQPVRAIELPGDIFTEKDLQAVRPWFPEAKVTLYARAGGMM